MRPTGLEPVAYSSGGCRSIQLSYGRVVQKVIMNAHEIQPLDASRRSVIDGPTMSDARNPQSLRRFATRNPQSAIRDPQ